VASLLFAHLVQVEQVQHLVHLVQMLHQLQQLLEQHLDLQVQVLRPLSLLMQIL
jgi:predicted nucleotidyltransferase